MLYLGMRRKCCISPPGSPLALGVKKTICLERLEIDVPIRYHYSLQCKNNDKKQINFDMCGRFDSRFICRIHF